MGINSICWAPLNSDSDENIENKYPSIVSGSCDKSVKIFKWDE